MIQKIGLLFLFGLFAAAGYWEQSRVISKDVVQAPRNPASSENTDPSPSPQLYLVTKVIDGDTIEVLKEGVPTRVRYIGIDAPEHYPIERAECFGSEATIRNRALVEGKQVRLEIDIRDVDTYNRLLRYVYVDDVFVNALLLREGFAEAVIFPPDTAFADSFATLEAAAQTSAQGLWAACASKKGRSLP